MRSAIPDPPEPGAAPWLPKLLDRLRADLRTRHDSIRTEDACVDWARRFIVHHGKRHPAAGRDGGGGGG